MLVIAIRQVILRALVRGNPKIGEDPTRHGRQAVDDDPISQDFLRLHQDGLFGAGRTPGPEIV